MWTVDNNKSFWSAFSLVSYEQNQCYSQSFFNDMLWCRLLTLSRIFMTAEPIRLKIRSFASLSPNYLKIFFSNVIQWNFQWNTKNHIMQKVFRDLIYNFSVYCLFVKHIYSKSQKKLTIKTLEQGVKYVQI